MITKNIRDFWLKNFLFYYARNTHTISQQQAIQNIINHSIFTQMPIDYSRNRQGQLRFCKEVFWPSCGLQITTYPKKIYKQLINRKFANIDAAIGFFVSDNSPGNQLASFYQLKHPRMSIQLSLNDLIEILVSLCKQLGIYWDADSVDGDKLTVFLTTHFGKAINDAGLIIYPKAEL